MNISSMQPGDWPAVLNIYLEGIATGNATFQQTAPDWDDWDAGHLPSCRLVARSGPDVLSRDVPGWDVAGWDVMGLDVMGWAALSAVSKRPVYAGVAEVSIYVAAKSRGQGVGNALLASLIQASEAAGFWTLQAGIFPENEASIALHRRHGFRIVGTRERIGRGGGGWRDVVLLERRSSVTGVA